MALYQSFATRHYDSDGISARPIYPKEKLLFGVKIKYI